MKEKVCVFKENMRQIMCISFYLFHPYVEIAEPEVNLLIKNVNLIFLPESIPDPEYTARIQCVNPNFLIIMPESFPDPE